MMSGEGERKNSVFIMSKPSLNPDIDMEYGARFPLFELKKEYL